MSLFIELSPKFICSAQFILGRLRQAFIISILAMSTNASGQEVVGYTHGTHSTPSSAWHITITSTPAKELFNFLQLESTTINGIESKFGSHVICQRVRTAIKGVGNIDQFSCEFEFNDNGESRTISNLINSPNREIPYDNNCCDMSSYRAEGVIAIRTGLAKRIYQQVMIKNGKSLAGASGNSFGVLKCEQKRTLRRTRGGYTMYAPLSSICSIRFDQSGRQLSLSSAH